MKRYFEPYRLSLLQRAFLIPYFSAGAILDPTRGEMVAGLGDVTNCQAVQRMKDSLMQSEAGRSLLQRKPLVTEKSLDYPALRQLPEGSLGRGYVLYMDSHGFSADERPPVRFMEDEDLAYVMTRYRQVHDYWHVLTGLPPSELGEIAQKAFEWRVTGLPIGLLSTLFGPLRLPSEEKRLLYRVYLPWAMRAGAKAGDLLAFDYEAHLSTPVDIVRQMLNFEAPPPLQYNPK
eukprot:gene3668-4014_t